MKFVMSYSCGKDSTLAMHRMLEQGHEMVKAIVIVNEDMERSFFHGANYITLMDYACAFGEKLSFLPTKGENYHTAMESMLARAKEEGAEAACFGDIDIEANRRWCEERCAKVGLRPVFPLWKRDREEAVREVIGLGYKCLIKSVNNTLLPKSLLGKFLNEETLKLIRDCGVDVCGEQGEYHTMVIDGPVFKTPVAYELREILDFGDYSVIDTDAVKLTHI